MAVMQKKEKDLIVKQIRARAPSEARNDIEDDEGEEIAVKRKKVPKRSQSALGGPRRNAQKKKSDEESEERNEGEDSEKDTPRAKLATI